MLPSSCKSALPLIPALMTARALPSLPPCGLWSRSASQLGQRWLASGVEPMPSVIESPNATMSCAPGGLSTSMAAMTYQDSDEPALRKSSLPLKSPDVDR